MRSRMLAAAALAVVASASLPVAAGAQADGSGGGPPPAGNPPSGEEPPSDPVEPQPAELSIRVKGLRRGMRPALRRTTAVGRVEPFVPAQVVNVQLVRRGKTVKRKRVEVSAVGDATSGSFRLRSPRLTKPGKYRVRAVKPATPEQSGARTTTERFRLRYPGLKQGDRGRAVAFLNKGLRKQGYHAPKGRHFKSETARAVLAFRKVNRMPPGQKAPPQILKRLAKGKGAFKLRRGGAGRHVEVDLRRQVMVLAHRHKPQHTFSISSGRSSLPTARGHFRFYKRQPGYNAVHMYYSVYFNRGQAIHGYDSVPNYPASHGCIREAIPDARFIYSWVRLGMSVYIY